MRYSKSWTQAYMEVQEQVGVRKVDFVDGITPDLQEAKPEFEVKYASSKKGPIKVSKFMSLEDAKKFLAQIKKEGMNGIISKGGKPVKEALDDEDEPVVKKVVKMLKKASQAHAGQADDLEKSMKEAVKFDAGKMAALAKKDKMIAQMMKKGSAKAVFNSEVLGDSAMEKKYQAEDVEESMALQMKMAADDIETYAKKHGGIDKKDMMKAAAMLKKGDKTGAMKFIKTLDTDPRDYLMKAMGEEDTNEAYVMHKGMKVKNVPRSAGKDATQANKDRKAAQRKKLGLEEVEVDEKASDYEDQIKAFLAKGGKIQKGDKPDKKKIDKVTKGFMKKLGVMKKKEAELDAKDKEELEKMMGEEMMNEHCGECGAMDHVDENLNEADYELYHKTFSGAMQHAYAHAKKKGYIVDPDEIDNKVATGPKKPSSGKTNRYILGTNKKQKLHVQVANLDNKRFELNMYIEETEKEKMDIEETIKQVIEGKYKKKTEDASNDKSDDGEGLDKVDPKAVKKKFKDRKDQDIDNDGDTDSTDKYLHKKRKAISKAVDQEDDEEQKEDHTPAQDTVKGKGSSKDKKPLAKYEETDSPLYAQVKKLLRNK